MNINKLTIKQAKKIMKLLGGVPETQKDILSHLIGKHVLIRDNNAGLFVTTLKEVRGPEWVGAKSRKIHFWSKAGAVEGIAETGINLDESRITVETEMSCGKCLVQACLVKEDVYKKLMGAEAWNPK